MYCTVIKHSGHLKIRGKCRNVELPLPALSSRASRSLFSPWFTPLSSHFSEATTLVTIYLLCVCFHELTHALTHVKIETKFKEYVRTEFGHY